jgi:hypothetical protein
MAELLNDFNLHLQFFRSLNLQLSDIHFCKERWTECTHETDEGEISYNYFNDKFLLCRSSSLGLINSLGNGEKLEEIKLLYEEWKQKERLNPKLSPFNKILLDLYIYIEANLNAEVINKILRPYFPVKTEEFIATFNDTEIGSKSTKWLSSFKGYIKNKFLKWGLHAIASRKKYSLDKAIFNDYVAFETAYGSKLIK